MNLVLKLILVLYPAIILAKSAQQRNFFPEVDVSVLSHQSEPKTLSKKSKAPLKVSIEKNPNVLQDLSFNLLPFTTKESVTDLAFGQDIFTLTETAAPTEFPTTAPIAPTVAPTAAPSPQPSAAPSFTPVPTTFAPTSPGAQSATIALSQAVSGVTASQWDQNAAANCKIFKLSVVSVSKGLVTYDQISDCTVTDARRRRLRRMLIELLASSVNVGYSISVPASTDINSVTTSITTSISTAVSNGNFTSTMNSVATSQSSSLNYSSPLAAASSSSVAVQSVSVTGASSNNNNNLTSGQIAGIVIGVLVGSFCIAMGCYALILNGRSFWSANTAEEQREFAVNLGLTDEESMYITNDAHSRPAIEDAPRKEYAAPEPPLELAPVVETPLVVEPPHEDDFHVEEVLVVREDETTQL